MFRYLILIYLFTFAPVSIANGDEPKLVIYTSNTFISDWGPGPSIKPVFEKECRCSVNFVPVADGAALLARLQIEKNRTKADVVVGLDDTIITLADKLNIFMDSGVTTHSHNLPLEFNHSKIYVPFDFGYYTFMFDTKAKLKSGKPYPRPQSFDDLINNPAFEKSVIVQDPRTSAPGFGLLLWMHVLYGSSVTEKLAKFKKQVLTISRGWSESYNLFTKGEAPIVFSYSTSEGYHRELEKTDRYQALIFDEGHLLTVETAAIVKFTKNQKLAKEFIRFLLRPEIQAIIASKNWMYPVIAVNSGLPASYKALKIPSKIFQTAPQEIYNRRSQWIEEWQRIFRN